jgi:nitrous oxidase accessory protein NosD
MRRAARRVVTCERRLPIARTLRNVALAARDLPGAVFSPSTQAFDRDLRVRSSDSPVTRRRSPIRSRWPLAIAACVAGAMACTLVYESEFLVVFDAESETAAQALALEYTVFDDEGAVADERRLELGASLAFPTPELPIRPRDGDWERTFTVRGRVLRTASDGSLEVFNERSFRSSFPRPGERGRQRHRLVFSDDCILFHRMCSEGETCVDGRCAPIPFVPPSGRDPTLRTVEVRTADELAGAVTNARAGDAIEIEPGTYDVTANLVSRVSGAEGAPIVVRAREPGTVLLRYVGTGTAEVFLVRHPWWVIEGLDVEGACATDDACEHAFHVTGDATNVVIRDNRMWDFNQALHANRDRDGTPPDDGLFEHNEVFLTRPRAASNRITGLRMSGVSRWIVRGNVIRDVAHVTDTAYAAYFVDGGEDGTFEGNLVWCRDAVDGGGGRVGLAVGVVASPPEHTRAVFRNDVVRGCEGGNGILLHGCADCRLEHETVLGALRVQASSRVTTIGTLFTGAVSVATDSTHESRGDVFEAPLSSFVDVGSDLRPRDTIGSSDATIERDFCGRARGGAPTIGALEPDSPCDGSWVLGTRGGP